MYAVFIITIIFVFSVGAVVGSFLNVLAYRIPRGLDFVKGFSFCPNCASRLHAKDLVPVFSYLLLGRKCRYCGQPISPRYMLNEILTGVLALVAYCAFLPPASSLASPGAPGLFAAADPAAAVLYFAMLCILLTIAWIDADTMEIPDALNIAAAVCGVVSIWVGPEMPLKTHLIGIAAVSVPLFVISVFVAGAFGLGDVLLMAAAGLFLGWQGVVVAAFIGIVIGGVYGVHLLVSKKKSGKEHFAFGPALCVGIGVAMFAGRPMMDWYLGLM
jgi:leader peptidase (prepilin peptidase)/N-methyltransferase